MTALTSIEYPYWLMFLGAFLLLVGSIGLALQPRSLQIEDSDDETSDSEEQDPVEAYNQTAREKRKARWAETSDEEPWDAEPKAQQLTEPSEHDDQDPLDHLQELGGKAGGGPSSH
jgi:hypothetical protein